MIGGETSLRTRMDAGVTITAIKEEDLPPALLEDETEHGYAMARVQRYEAKILFACGPPNEEQKCLVVQGGDRAAWHSFFGIGSCIHSMGICGRCIRNRKSGWTVEADCAKALPRKAVYQSVACHVDPRPRMPGYENIDPFRCPHCLATITAEFSASEQLKHDGLSLSAQGIADRKFITDHDGAVRGNEVVQLQDPLWRGTSNLHRRTNCAQNNIVATFMQVRFDQAMRQEANRACENAGMLFKFPTANAKQRCPRLGNGDDARILHCHPLLLVQLVQIFYKAQLNEPGVSEKVQALTKAAMAAVAAGVGGKAKKSKPKKAPFCGQKTLPGGENQKRKPKAPKRKKAAPKGAPAVTAAKQAAPQADDVAVYRAAKKAKVAPGDTSAGVATAAPAPAPTEVGSLLIPCYPSLVVLQLHLCTCPDAKT